MNVFEKVEVIVNPETLTKYVRLIANASMAIGNNAGT